MTIIDVYARVSRASDKRDRSTSGQVAECKALLIERGHQIGMVHVDSSKSAWNTKVLRPGWQALMRRLDTQQTDGVIIFEMSRFSRRSEEGLRLLRLAEAGALVMDSEGEYDLSKPKQARNFRDAISAAEYESAMIGERTKRGKRAKARDEGEFNSSTRAFGFELGNILPREAEAAALRDAAERLVAGEDQVSICNDLNRRGLLTTLAGVTKTTANGPITLNGLWKPASLRMALTRPANVGDVVYGGEVVHAGKHPGILDRDLYARVCGLYAGRKRGRPTINLATGFVQCGACGQGLRAKELVRHKPYADGEARKAYLCIRRDGGCGNAIDWHDLDEHVRKVALEVLTDPVQTEAIEAGARAVNAELDTVTAKITELEATAEEMGERLGRGQITLKRHDGVVGPLDAQLVKLYAHQSRLIAEMPAREAVAKVESRDVWERRWDRADITKRREYIKRAFRGRKLLVSAGPRLMPARERTEFGV